MKVTVLMENTALEGCGLTPEHGLSLYIQYRGKKLLLDAGSSGKFADNAQALGVDLSGVELAALSHGHYDHADGLRRFFQVNDRAKVYLRPGAEGPYFAKDPDAYRFIGIGRDIWENTRDRFVEVEGLYPLLEGAWLVPETVHDPAFAGQAADLLVKRGRTILSPTTTGMSSPWCWRGSGAWWSLTHAATGGSSILSGGCWSSFPGKSLRCGGRLSHVQPGQERHELYPRIRVPGGRRPERAGGGGDLHRPLHRRNGPGAPPGALRPRLSRSGYGTGVEPLKNGCKEPEFAV